MRKVALITGAAKRVGRAIALRLAKAEYDVAFTYHHSDADAQSLVQEIGALGIQCDLTDVASIQTVRDKFLAAHSRLDVLVNNASLYEESSLYNATLEQMRRFWTIHMESPLL